MTERLRVETDLRERESLLILAQAIGQIGSWRAEMPMSGDIRASDYRSTRVAQNRIVSHDWFAEVSRRPEDYRILLGNTLNFFFSDHGSRSVYPNAQGNIKMRFVSHKGAKHTKKNLRALVPS